MSAGIARAMPYRERVAARDAPLEERSRDEQHEGRVDEEQQPLEGRGHVLQAEEIEVAGEVVAHEAQAQHAPEVAPRQRLRGRPARGPRREDREERRAEEHAKGEERDGVHAVAVGELDDHRLAGERHGGGHHHQRAGYAGLPFGHAAIESDSVGGTREALLLQCLGVREPALGGEHQRLDAMRVAGEAREAGGVAHRHAHVVEVERGVGEPGECLGIGFGHQPQHRELVVAHAAEEDVALATRDREAAREAVYGMPYSEWKKRQPEASQEQLDRMAASVARNKA
jgi:hypothetical protein